MEPVTIVSAGASMEDTMLRFRRASPLSVLVATTMLLPAFLAPTVAQAALNDDDLYCYIVGSGDDVECETVGSLRAQCKYMGAKPGEVEVCDDVRNMLVTPMSLSGSDGGGGGGGGGGGTPGRSLTPPGLGFTAPAPVN